MSAPIAGFRRLIKIAVKSGEARGIVVDEFHHFRVAISHKDDIITQVATQWARIPYTLCPAAAEQLSEIVGMPLSQRVTDTHARINTRQQCTHQFDLGALTIAAAVRGTGLTYRLLVSDPIDDFSDYSLHRDDGLTLEWRAQKNYIVSPDRFAGIDMVRGFTDWAARTLDEELCEAALTLRRAHMVANGRRIVDHLNALGQPRANGGCWVQQPERAPSASRIPHIKSDGLHDPEPNADDMAWLEFR